MSSKFGRAAAMVAFVLLLCGLGAMPATAEQATPSASMYVDSSQAEAEKSIVLVYTQWSGTITFFDDETQQWYESETYTKASACTGAFYSPEGHVGTAGHCVDPDQGAYVLVNSFMEQYHLDGDHVDSVRNVNRDVVQVVQPRSVEDAVVEEWTTVDVIDYQVPKDGDHALLKLNISKQTPALAVADKLGEPGDEVVTYGFSGDVMELMDPESIAVDRASGAISSVGKKYDGTPFTGVDMSMAHGMSGGPAFDSQGKVIGLNSRGPQTGSADLNFVTDLGYFRTFMKSNGVELLSSKAGGSDSGNTKPGPKPGNPGSLGTSQTADSSDGIPTWAIVVGSIVLGLLILGAALVWAFRKKRQQAAYTAAAGQGRPYTQSTMPYANQPDVRCSQGHENQRGAAFCSSCGRPLSPQAPDTYGG